MDEKAESGIRTTRVLIWLIEAVVALAALGVIALCIATPADCGKVCGTQGVKRAEGNVCECR